MKLAAGGRHQSAAAASLRLPSGELSSRAQRAARSDRAGFWSGGWPQGAASKGIWTVLGGQLHRSLRVGCIDAAVVPARHAVLVRHVENSKQVRRK